MTPFFAKQELFSRKQMPLKDKLLQNPAISLSSLVEGIHADIARSKQ
jgi:hypothetical protein